MLHIAQGRYLLLLLLIPIFFLLYSLYLKLKRKKLQKFGNLETVKQLMPDVSNGRGWLKISLFAIAFFFFVIGLSRPQLGARIKEKEIKGVEIMIALDVSNSMLAEDFSPNRLERAKLAISRLVDKLQGDRIGLVIFAGESFIQLPITTDYVSAKVFLNNINTNSIPVQGTSIADALMTTARSFSTQSEQSRALILITDGEDHEGAVMDAARAIGDSGIKIYCIGIGTPEGQPIPMNGELLKDENGDIVVTRLDESLLRKIAEAGNGSYVRAGAAEFGLNPIIESIRQIEDQNFKSVVFEDFDEQYMYFFAIALFFLILDLFIGERKNGKNIFN